MNNIYTISKKLNYSTETQTTKSKVDHIISIIKSKMDALGFEYRASTDKKSFLENIDWFTSCKLTDKPLVWEAFTNEVDENASILYMNTLNESAKGIAKRIAKAILPESVQRKITEHIGRTK